MIPPPAIIHATPDGRWFERGWPSTSLYTYKLLVQEERRSSEQNSKMWAMLTEFSQQLKHAGRYYEPERWKAILLHAWG